MDKHAECSTVPAWFRLNERWRDKGNFGLTILFLVGALQVWPGKPLGDTAGIEQLRALLCSLRDDVPDGLVVRLYSCDKIQDLALAPVGGIPQYCFPVSSQRCSAPSFYVEVGVVPNGETSFEKLLDALWQRYGKEIERACFSRRGGLFQPFDADDKALISEAIAAVDDDV